MARAQTLSRLMDGMKISEGTLSTSSQLPIAPHSRAAIDLLGRFDNAERLLSMYNPSLQTEYCRDVQRVFFGTAPTLAVVCEAYGRKTAELWLEIQLHDLSEFSGCKEKLRPARIEEVAKMIFNAFPHYKLTEFMLFFQRFKSCCYGRFYGAVDPIIIIGALEDFKQERLQAYIDQRAREEKEQAAAREAAAAVAQQELHNRYRARVPDADTPQAAMTLRQYAVLGYDGKSDEELRRDLDDIAAGLIDVCAEENRAYNFLRTISNAK